MKLEELIELYRPHMADESIGLRRSWEEMFRYTLKYYPKETSLEAFDLKVLADRLSSAGVHQPIVAGYIKRWQDLLKLAGDL